MFINTALVPLLANSAVFNIKLSEIMYDLLNPILPSAFNTEFKTEEIYSRDWYLNVGEKIIISMIINIFSPHVIYILTIPFRKKLRESKAKKCRF